MTCVFEKKEIAIIVMIDINQRLLPFFLSILQTGANRWDLELVSRDSNANNNIKCLTKSNSSRSHEKILDQCPLHFH